MNKNKISHIFSIFFVIVILFFFTSIAVTYILNHYGLYNQTEQDLTYVDEDSNAAQPDGMWLEKYPFSEKYTFYQEESSAKGDENKDTDDSSDNAYLSFCEGIKSKVEYYATDLLVGRIKFVEANAFFNKLIGMKLITGTDSVAVMNNGYLTYEAYEVDTENAAESVKWFNDTLREKGIDFLYVQCPSKENKYDCQLPVGMSDRNNSNADSLLDKLNATDVKTLDLRPLLNAESEGYYSYFFKTDHHWKPEAGVWASGKIADAINSFFGSNIDTSIGNIDNYNVKVYEDYCFGSQGKKVSLSFADPEDISLITPKEKTDFTVSYCEGEEKTEIFPKR